MIFIFLPCREMAHDEEEFSHDNSKPHHEHELRPVQSNPVYIYIYMLYIIYIYYIVYISYIYYIYNIYIYI